MRTPYTDRSQFEEKAAVLADALGMDAQSGQLLLAQLSGYDDETAVEYGGKDRSMWSSREELIARLLSSRPGMASDQAGEIIDRLALAVRDTDMEHIASSPDVVPNMGS